MEKKEEKFSSVARGLGNYVDALKMINDFSSSAEREESEEFDHLEDRFLAERLTLETLEARIDKGPVPEMPVGPPLIRIRLVPDTEDYERQKSYWLGLDDEFTRNFLKVPISELKTYVEAKTGAVKDLEIVLKYVKKNLKWIAWICRTCSKKFSTRQACHDHLEQEHATGLIPSQRMHMPQRISEDWADKVSSVRDWKPVDAVAAVQMIKDQSAHVKSFVYQDGWCNDWPLATDQVIARSQLLKEIRSLLVTFIQHKVLSDSFRERVVYSLVLKLGISKQKLKDCRLLETPQSICFLECDELNRILVFLRKIKSKRDDGTNLVCQAVDGFLQSSLFRGKISVDLQFSFLLLDKQLLLGELKHYDDEGKLQFLVPSDYYGKVRSRGDAILTWLHDNVNVSQEEDGFVLLVAKIARKKQLVEDSNALHEAQILCQQKKKEKDETKQVLATLLPETSPEFYVAHIDILSKLTDDDDILASIGNLFSGVLEEVAETDSSILLIEKSRIALLGELNQLAFFDYRSYVARHLKKFLLTKL
ncbi:unnamed protein product [Arabidopsis thaliana]|uniref:C2H2-type domain-containing protein n=1 Tax=Arabidopsis thaliana TaxID=3702 RepID=A0A654FXM5_ARATH|nr:unnamed protein product [Arabidopsis thaliana]